MHIYIHDLDVKQEMQARKAILHCGADHAIHVRFAQELENASMWILKNVSAFLHYALKQSTQHQLEILTYNRGVFHRATNDLQIPLSTRALCQLSMTG